MSFSSFTQSIRSTEVDDNSKISSIASFIPFVASKFGRSRSGTRRSSAESTASESDFSSTDAGDDIEATYVDLDDFTSASSDDEVSADESSPKCKTEAGNSAAACVYSIMMLLHIRNAMSEEETEDELRYSSCSYSDLPHASLKSKSITKATPSTTAGTTDSSMNNMSWRQSLPQSTPDSWIAQVRRRSTGEEQDENDENVTRAARSILNKLTVEKFKSLFERLATCGITCPKHVSMLMHEVFEKATTQHHFIPMYAELCVKLEKDPRIAAAVEEADLPNNFRRLLLNECQRVFEQLFDAATTHDEGDEEAGFRRKQQAIGNMKLIGQLLVQGMLSPDLFTTCCEELLSRHGEFPEALESLVALIMVAGPKFDYRAWQFSLRLEDIFAKMRTLTKDKAVAPRLRFLMRDVLDARDAGWPAKARGKAPSTLEEVRTEPVQQKSLSPAVNAKESAIAKDHNRKQVVTFENKKVEVKQPEHRAFNVVNFRRELNAIFTDLASDKNIPGAVQRVREQRVPSDQQAGQFMDILTRVVEERRGAVRRCELAFLTGLAAAENSAFERKECLAGIGRFFDEVYADLLNEVHRLPAIVKSEFLPTALTVFSSEDLNNVVPPSMRKP